MGLFNAVVLPMVHFGSNAALRPGSIARYALADYGHRPVIKNARGDGDRRCLKLAFLVAVALMACQAADAASNLLSNGNMEEPGPKPNRIAGWSDWLWEGDAQLSQTTEAAFEGRRSALLQG